MKSIISHIIAVILLSLLYGRSSAGDRIVSAPEELPKTLTLYSGFVPRNVVPGFKGFVSQMSEVNNKRFAQGAFIATKDEWWGADFPGFWNARVDDYSIYYPRLVADDIVPILGKLFYVTSVGGTGRDCNVSFAVLPEEKLPKEAKISKDAYAFTIGLGGGGRLHGVQFSVAAAAAEPNAPDGAAVTIGAHSCDPPVGPRIARWEKTVRVGDEVRFALTTHRVCNIVLPDAKQQIIGWIEFDQKPVKDDRPPPEVILRIPSPKAPAPEPQPAKPKDDKETRDEGKAEGQPAGKPSK